MSFAMPGIASVAARILALIATTAGVLAAPCAAHAAELDRAVAAVEACLETHVDRPSSCRGAAEAFCRSPDDLSCPRFETAVWRGVADNAERRIASTFPGAVDEAFVDDAADDVRRGQLRHCQMRAGGNSQPERAVALCLLEKTASRAIALWRLAKSDFLDANKP